MLAELPRQRLGHRPRVARDGQVEVGDRAAEGRVAHRPTRDPDALGAAQSASRGARERRRAKVVGEAHGRPAGIRGTRGEIPQVTS